MGLIFLRPFYQLCISSACTDAGTAVSIQLVQYELIVFSFLFC